MDEHVELPITFTTPNAPAVWGIISLVMALVFTIFITSGAAIHSNKDLFSGIGVIIMFTFCGFKLVLERFVYKIIATNEQLISKSIFGNITAITWAEIKSVTLVQKPAGFMIKSDDKIIKASLKLKSWEVLLEVLEDNVADEKFFGF